MTCNKYFKCFYWLLLSELIFQLVYPTTINDLIDFKSVDGKICDVDRKHMCQGGRCEPLIDTQELECCSSDAGDPCSWNAHCCWGLACRDAKCQKLQDGESCGQTLEVKKANKKLCKSGRCTKFFDKRYDYSYYTCCSSQAGEPCLTDSNCCRDLLCTDNKCALAQE